MARRKPDEPRGADDPPGAGGRATWAAPVAGTLLLFLGLLSHFLLTTPVASFFDPRWVGALLTSAGILVLGLFVLRSGFPSTRSGLLIGGVSLAAAGVLAHDFLDHREVPVHFSDGGVELTGTLFEPRSPGPHPAVVMMHGSSPGTRGIFRPMANALVRREIAVLTYDKRGFGDSEGHLPYTYPELAEDALAGVELLRERPGIDGNAVGLMGFSEGGWTAPLAAEQSEGRVRYLVVVSGSALTPAEQGLWEMRSRLEDRGFGAEDVAHALRLQRRLNDYYRTGAGGGRLMRAIQRSKGTPWFRVGFELDRDEVPDSLGAVEYTHDPGELDFEVLPRLRRLEIPLLFVFGEGDRIVPPTRSASLLHRALGGDESGTVQVRTFPRADHLLLVWPLGHRLPWARFAPGYLEFLGSWIVRVTGRSTERPQDGGAGEAGPAPAGQGSRAAGLSAPTSRRRLLRRSP